MSASSSAVSGGKVSPEAENFLRFGVGPVALGLAVTDERDPPSRRHFDPAETGHDAPFHLVARHEEKLGREEPGSTASVELADPRDARPGPKNPVTGEFAWMGAAEWSERTGLQVFGESCPVG